jgi:hypothetical protein
MISRLTTTAKSAKAWMPLALLGVLAIGSWVAWTALAASPSPTITAAPSNPTNATNATFTYTLSGAAGFLCKMDAGGFATCANTGKTYTGLSQGQHTFQVEGADKNGKANSPATSYTWTIDTTPPTVAPTITGPTGLVNSTSATFSFSGETGAKFQCALESQTNLAACTNPISYTGLAQGAHTIYVRQIDAAGNVGTAVASRAWTIDSVAPPAPVIGTKPDDPNGDGIANFSWTDAEAGVTFRCALENKTATSCTSPLRTIIDVSNDGQHQFIVSAVDAAGNVSTTSYTWKVLKAVNVVVDGDAVGLLYPGAPAQRIALTLHNPNNFPVVMSSIDTSVSSSPSGCPAESVGGNPANVAIVQSTVGSANTFTVPANQNLPLPAALSPTIQLVDTHRNQDACKNGTFKLTYLATGAK